VVTGYTVDAWESFFVANAGAAAALAGLLFVGVSINLETIAPSGQLTRRALEAFSLLVTVLFISVLGLVPDISTTLLGWLLAAIGALLAALVVSVSARTFVTGTDDGVPAASPAARMALGLAAATPLIIAGVTLAADGGGGLYWVAPAVLFSYLAALANAWVLMIEILR
jgi:modulator of FtsH protease